MPGVVGQCMILQSSVIVTGVPTKAYRLPTEWIQPNSTVVNVASFKNVDEEALLKVPGVVYVPMVGKVTVAILGECVRGFLSHALAFGAHMCTRRACIAPSPLTLLLPPQCDFLHQNGTLCVSSINSIILYANSNNPWQKCSLGMDIHSICIPQ